MSLHHSISCPFGLPETMKRPVGWVERSAACQAFSKQFFMSLRATLKP